MSNEKTVNAGVAAEAPVKKVRRGVSNETQATAQLRFHEKDAAPNRLFVAHLHDVSVQWSVNADGKQFTGERVPRLTFEFASNTKDASQMRHVYHSLFPVESNVNTIPGGSEEWNQLKKKKLKNLLKLKKKLLLFLSVISMMMETMFLLKYLKFQLVMLNCLPMLLL